MTCHINVPAMQPEIVSDHRHTCRTIATRVGPSPHVSDHRHTYTALPFLQDPWRKGGDSFEAGKLIS